MKAKLKHMAVLMTIIITIFTLTGCNNVKIRTDTKVNIDGTSETILKVYYDDSINKLINGELLEGIISNVGEDILGPITLGEVETYKDGEFNVEQVQIKTTKIDLNNIKELSGTEYIDIKVKESKGLIFNTYKVTLKLNNSILNILSENLNSYLNEYINFNMQSLINKSLDSTIGSVQYDLAISIPMKIINTNANERVDEKTVLYSYTLSELNEENEMILSFKIINVFNIVAIGLVIMLSIILLLIKMKKKNK